MPRTLISPRFSIKNLSTLVLMQKTARGFWYPSLYALTPVPPKCATPFLLDKGKSCVLFCIKSEFKRRGATRLSAPDVECANVGDGYVAGECAIPLTRRVASGVSGGVVVDWPSEPVGVVLPVKEDVSVSSGIVENFFSTCLSAGLRMGLLRKWSMPES
jgi:hypothetical protein